jgi:Subtilase family
VLLAALAASLAGLFEVCDDQVAQTGNEGVVEVCRGLSLTDPAIFFVALLVIFCLWPDLSEISIGVFRLTRKVEEQAERTEQVGREIQLLGLELRQTIAQNVQQQVVQYIGTAETAPPRDVRSSDRPTRRSTRDELFEPLFSQAGYAEAGIVEARRLLREVKLAPVRVALVGAAITPELRQVEALRAHIEPPFVATGAAAGPAEVAPTGTASVGHVLAIAPSAVVSPVSVLTPRGVLDPPSALYEGIVAALAQRPDVLIIGLGGGAPVLDIESLLTGKATETCVVAPAGNESKPASSWPAALSSVVSVAAVESGERAQFSNFGAGVDIAAPGVSVTSLIGVTAAGRLQFGEISGTSVAADIVGGVAALLVAAKLAAPVEVVQLLARTASRQTSEGIPIVDAAAAVEEARS